MKAMAMCIQNHLPEMEKAAKEAEKARKEKWEADAKKKLDHFVLR